MTSYPSAVDYTLALQNPASAFADTRLQGATFTQGFMGPYCITGSSAVVFQAKVGGSDYALRCYTREDASTPDRYSALDAFVATHGLSKYVGNVTWYQEQVQVRNVRWPVLTMEWIEGQQLHEYVGYLADNRNTDALRTLAWEWLALVGDLQRARFAHGDLQHGNILVDRQGRLRLVDFDSIWIPPLDGQEAPAELGHPSYQPQDVSESRWGPYMDTFSGLVIYLALTALAREPALWAKFNNGENILFERADFTPPFGTAIWKALAGLGDAAVDGIVPRLMACCQPGWVASASIADALGGPATAVTTTKGTSAAEASTAGTSSAMPKNWWENPGMPPSPFPSAVSPTGSTVTPTGAPAASPAGNSAWYTMAPLPNLAQPTMTMPPPSGTLPPPPTGPYQSTVSQQTGVRPAGAQQPGAKGGSWWAQQPPAAKTPPAGKQPSAGKTPGAPAKPGQGPSPARVVTGVLLLVVGIIVAVVLVVHHAAAWGALIGAAAAGAGLERIMRKPPSPPGNPPASAGRP